MDGFTEVEYRSWESQYGIEPLEPRKMTICIAAICEYGRGLILAGDTEVGLGFTKTALADGKFLSLFSKYHEWSAGISGNVTNATDVLFHLRQEEDKLDDFSVVSVRAAVERAYRRARLKAAESRYLGNRGWTLEEFKKEGSSRLPITTYISIDNNISSFDFDADLIISGFGEDDIGPTVLTIRNPGVSADHTKLGFWCVGSGSPLAQASLFSREYNWGMPFEKAAYFVFEAKKVAQAATGINDETNLFLIRKNLTPIQIKEPSLGELQTMFDELKPREFKTDHSERLAALVEFRMMRPS